MCRFPNRARRRGMTMVELLVVITILVILVAVMLPMMQVGSQARIVREATREVNALFAGAQARAIASGRPVGVMFIRTPNNNSQCFQLAIAKVPPPYSGLNPASAAKVNASSGAYLVTFWTNSSASTPEVIPVSLLPVGSAFQIRLNHRGPWYSGVRGSGNTYQLVMNISDLPPPIGMALPFQLRRPPRPSAAAPTDLPVGAYVDLNLSGVGEFGTELAPATPNSTTSPIILFGPRGGVEWVYRSQAIDSDGDGTPDGEAYGPLVPLDSIHILIGSAADLETPAATSMANLAIDAESLWLSVDPRSGKANSTESLGMPPGNNLADMLRASRSAAIAGQSMGGR